MRTVANKEESEVASVLVSNALYWKVPSSQFVLESSFFTVSPHFHHRQRQ